MSVLDNLFNKRFNAAKCKTMLKLTIPRIKLLRNRKEIQLKLMRREIAKLLETGQEATARIRVEHIIREEKMMAAQEIIELFSELITVRLPIIEAQRECPLDLKEAISSLCFAAPRCADLPELLQVQILFAGKYSKEFVSAATELMPECGVNRQLVELLSIRAPAPDVKLKLLKEIAEEHELDWDPSVSESELLKPHEDLLNGPTQFVSGSKLPLPKEKHEEMAKMTSENVNSERYDPDEDFDIIDFPEVPTQSLQSNKASGSAPEMLPFPPSALSEIDDQEEINPSVDIGSLPKLNPDDRVQEKPFIKEGGPPTISDGPVEEKHLLPFLSPPSSNISVVPGDEKQFPPLLAPPSQSSASSSVRKYDIPPSVSKSDGDNIDLQDVLAAAQEAVKSAEHAAAAARLAASIAQLRISGLTNNRSGVSVSVVGNPFHLEKSNSGIREKVDFDKQTTFVDSDSLLTSPSQSNDSGTYTTHFPTVQPSLDDTKGEVNSSSGSSPVLKHGTDPHQPQRLPSMDDESYFSYPNLFMSQASNLSSGAESFKQFK